MGGFTSGPTRVAKDRLVLAECLTVAIPSLRGLLKGHVQRLELTWRDPQSGDVIGTMALTLELATAEHHTLHASYTVADAEGVRHDVKQTIRLTPTRLPSQGARWWFVCPECSCRVGILALAPGTHSWGCRRCLEITSASRRDRRSLKADRESWKPPVPTIPDT